MLDDDDSVRDALRDALGPESEAPPPAGRTDDVLRDVVAEGKRRVFGQRVAAAVGVVAVVGVVAFAATALGGRSLPGRVSSAAGPTVITATSAASAPAATPMSTMTSEPGADSVLMPGWEWARMAPVSRGSSCDTALPPVAIAQSGSLPNGAIVQEVLASAVLKMDPQAKVGMTESVWSAHDPRNGGPRGYVSLDVTDAGGPGAVDVEIQRYVGSPREAADLDAFAYGSCAEPQRRVMSDGAVLQMYPYNPTADPKQPTRYVRIYEPNGREYIIGDLGWGSVDLKQVPGDEAGTKAVIGGRGSVPLNDLQLANVAERVAEVG